MLRPRLSALQSALPSFADRFSFRFTNGILRFANSYIEYLLGKLYGIARTFGHKPSIAQAVPSI